MDVVFWPKIPLTTRIFAFIRSMFMMFIVEGLFLWEYRQGKRNEMADMEGPVYIPGAPPRNIGNKEDGRAVLAADEELKESVPLLLAGQVVSTTGQPIPNVEMDAWQADVHGLYYFDKYRLRGTFRTDNQGRFECLTSLPGAYGPKAFARAGHIHIILTAPSGEVMTTQMYFCPANDPKALKNDLANYVRKARLVNMVHAFCAPTSQESSSNGFPSSEGSSRFMDLPSFEEERDSVQQKGDEEAKVNLDRMKKSMDWWNARLASKGLKIGIGGYKVIKMAVKEKME